MRNLEGMHVPYPTFLQLLWEIIHYFLSTLLVNEEANLMGTLIPLWLHPNDKKVNTALVQPSKWD